MTTELDKAEKNKMRPFISTWKRMSPDFILLINKLMFLIRRYGIDKVGEEYAIKHQAEFISAVHEGWKKAQKIIAAEVILRLEEISSLIAQSKDFHRKKNSNEKMRCLSESHKKQYEIKVLRRFIDSIAWTLFDGEHSTIRRLSLPDGNDNLSKNNIIDSMIAADSINKNLTSMAIISDLTTFVHAGDLVVCEIGKGIGLVEVKSGDKNIAFSHAAQFSVKQKDSSFDEIYTKNFNKKDIKHYSRTKKQWERLINISNTINKGCGYDYYRKEQVIIDDNGYIPDYYLQEVVNVWRVLNSERDWSIDVIDECVYIGAYKTEYAAFIGFNSWMDGTNFKGHVFNISDSIIFHFSQPLFNLNLPHELLEDIINNGVIIVLCLDYEKFMHFGNERYPGLLHLSPLSMGVSDVDDYFMVGNEAVCSYENGQEIFVGTGFEHRIIFDLQRPKNIIDWIYKGSDACMNEIK